MSEGQSNGGQVQRGLILMEQGRYSDAIDFFRGALAQNPHDAFALNRLALCQLQLPAEKDQALATIDCALACEPNESKHHAVRAYILCAQNRPKDALASARMASTLDPTNVFALNAQANAHCNLEEWADAERVARHALSLDADDSTAANLLAHSLRLQNKMAENAGQIAGMLARDPENARTHCSAGWAALQRGDRRSAEQHFLEALRLDPDMEQAREGLLNSFRARSPFYRAYLAYAFKMAQLRSRGRWGVVLGLYFGVRFARMFLTGPWAPLGKAVSLAYLVFVFWVWIARGLGNFILLFDRFAKHALRRNEKIEAGFVGGGVCAGLALLVASLFTTSIVPYLAALAFAASTVPLSLTFTNKARFGAILFGAVGFCALLAGLTLLLAWVLPTVIPEDPVMVLFAVGVIGAAATTWLGNIPALRQR